MENNTLLKEVTVLFQQENYRKIIEVIEEIPDKENLDYRIFRLLAISYLQTFQYNQALKAFDEAIKKYPKIEEKDYAIVEPLYSFAHKLLKNKQYEEFEKARKLLLKFNSDYYFFRSLYWKVLIVKEWERKGKLDQAITLVNHVLEAEKYLRLDIERERERETWQEKCFDRLQRARELAGEVPFILEELGLFSILILDFEEAEKYLRKAYMLNPGSETVRYHIGLLNEKKGFYDDAIKYYEEALEMDPTYRLCSRQINICKSKMLINEAIRLQRRGDFKEAIAKYRGSLELNPGDSEAKGKMQAAVKHHLNKKIREAKDLIAAHRYLEAEDLLNQLLEDNPENQEVKLIYYGLIETFHEQDTYKQARLKREKERDDTIILLSALEILRNKSLSQTEKLEFLEGELLKLSLEKQEKIVKKLSEVGNQGSETQKIFDDFLCQQLNQLNCTNSKFIPVEIDTNKLPADVWLTIQTRSKIKQFTGKYRNWSKNIPTIIIYDKTANKLIGEYGGLPLEATLLIDKKTEGPNGYQIWLTSDAQLILLKTKNYSEKIGADNNEVVEWVFGYEKTDLHQRIMQLHRYELNYNLDLKINLL